MLAARLRPTWGHFSAFSLNSRIWTSGFDSTSVVGEARKKRRDNQVVMTNTGAMEIAAATLLKRAVELDEERRYTEALVFYQSGIQQLMDVLKGILDSGKKQHFRDKISQYIDRAERIKEQVQKQKEAGKYHEQIRIQDKSIGHSYVKMFSHYLDPTLTEVEVEDPYIRNIHQIYNFLRFCEMLVTSNAKVKKINLLTGTDEGRDNERQQQARLSELVGSLRDHQVELTIEYSNTLHDREIRFNNGWVIKIGRGLDYFKAPKGKFCLGYCDNDLRPCYETTIDIFHRKHSSLG